MFRGKRTMLKGLIKTALIIPAFLLSGCVSGMPAADMSSLNELFKPTNVDRDEYAPECKRAWRGKTIYIDFDVNRTYWNNSYASSLAHDIRDKLTEDVVDDGCFHVTDKMSRRKFAYKVGIHVVSPRIRTNKNGVISKVSAKFRIKTYDNKDNLVKAKTRKVQYKRPMFVVVTNDSQDELLENYTHNVSIEIRKMFYESLGDNVSNRSTKKRRGSVSKTMSAQSRDFKVNKKYTTVSPVNMRSAPVNGKVVVVLAKGETVRAIGKKDGKWWFVKVKGKKGWVHSDYIQ